jgi:hypothetical protein
LVLAKQRRSAEANENSETLRENTKGRNQKDERRHSRHGLSSDDRAKAKARENKEEVDRSCPAFDEAMRGGIYMQG